MAQILTNHDELIAKEMGRLYADPLGFVDFSYDWGYGSLEGFNGPDDWQMEFLDRWGHEIKSRKFDGVTPVDPIQFLTSSGHGIGKSALTAWAVDFIMSTRPYAKGTVTANSAPQLRTKTWAEVQKWTKRCITGHWFDITDGQFMAMKHKQHPDEWRCFAQTCAKENSESFAGQHAANSTSFYIYDEASAIEDVIWEVSEGGMTDGEPMWLAFGNPTRSSGRFFQGFGKNKHRWIRYQIDSRKAKMTNKKKIQEWIDDYGEDSDFVKVRVKGVFPSAGSCQFIPTDEVNRCIGMTLQTEAFNSVVIGVDVARFGDDESVICIRRGRKVYPLQSYRGLDNVQLAQKVIEQIGMHKPQAVFVDGGGTGSGVVDYCRSLGYGVIEVNFGSSPRDPKKYSLKTDEIWGDMRDAVKAGVDLPDDQELMDQLIGREYGFTPKMQIKLEKKEDMKKRGLSSPDRADALALTYSENVVPIDHNRSYNSNSNFASHEYDELG